MASIFGFGKKVSAPSQTIARPHSSMLENVPAGKKFSITGRIVRVDSPTVAKTSDGEKLVVRFGLLIACSDMGAFLNITSWDPKSVADLKANDVVRVTVSKGQSGWYTGEKTGAKSMSVSLVSWAYDVNFVPFGGDSEPPIEF